ncbi:MAG: molybdopterin molybdotransferase MoeA [Bacteroidota bacterium]
MITVEQATDLILSHQVDFGKEQVALAETTARILGSAVRADRDFPSFNRVAMDGIAIKYADFEQGVRQFPIEAVAAAGRPQQSLKAKAHCLEVMTGVILPKGVDTVIRYEDIVVKNSVAHLQIEAIKARQNVHHQANDRAKDSILITKGKRINAAEIGVAASVGCTHLEVSKVPKTLIISTGDELVDIEATPLPHQIRRSNSYQLAAALQSLKITADLQHLQDDLDQLTQKLHTFLASYDLLILSGGVSKGKFDFVPKVLEDLGVRRHFHKIKQRPGKPIWFGTHPTQKTTIFALPGNPVSAFMCLHRYVIPWIEQSMGYIAAPKVFAQLQRDITFQPDLTYFAQVKCQVKETGQICAYPLEGKGSGDLANLVDADGFLELPRGSNLYKAGEHFRYWSYR